MMLRPGARQMAAYNDIKRQKERLEEILLTATAERKKIEQVHLPDEPDLKNMAPRISNDDFHQTVGGIMSRFQDKIAENEQRNASSDAMAAHPAPPPMVGRPSNWEA